MHTGGPAGADGGAGCAADGATWNSGRDSGGVGAWNRGVRTALDQALVGDFHEGVRDHRREDLGMKMKVPTLGGRGVCRVHRGAVCGCHGGDGNLRFL